MRLKYISRKVDSIREKYNESDPFVLAKAMGVMLVYQPMGNFEKACKGFFITQSRRRSITINSDLPKVIQRIICAHELGHAALHANTPGIDAFHDFNLFDSVSVTEHEANIFAAELLLKDQDVLELLNDDISFFDAAAALSVPPELLDFKFRVLKRKGYKIVDPPIQAGSKFLRDIEVNIREE